MALSRAQIILLKNAQRDAGLDDGDYREAIATVSGMADCRSSKDRRLTDGHLDKLLKWFEALYWALPEVARPKSSVFRTPNHWRDKNQRGNTSRDRFTEAELDGQIAELEAGLAEFGCRQQYCMAIQNSLQKSEAFTKANYVAALTRTLKSKRAKAESVPF